MKKTYWWRVSLPLVCLIIISSALLGPCNFKLGKCLGGDSILITRTFFHIFSSLLIVSVILFFINDNIFIKWLRFAAAWILATLIFVIISPANSSSIIGLSPTKELVSIWMGALFVIISIFLITYQYYKIKRK